MDVESPKCASEEAEVSFVSSKTSTAFIMRGFPLLYSPDPPGPCEEGVPLLALVGDEKLSKRMATVELVISPLGS